MKTLLKFVMAVSLSLAATSSYAWFGSNNNNNNNWGPFGGSGWNSDYNPYDEWDPRYWMEEMENMMDDDDYGYGGPGQYGPPPGYYGGQRPYGPPPGYRGPSSYGSPQGFAPGQRPYGPPPGYRGPAPQQMQQQMPPQQMPPQQAPQR